MPKETFSSLSSVPYNISALPQSDTTSHKFAPTGDMFFFNPLSFIILHYNHPLFILISKIEVGQRIYRNPIWNRSTLNIPAVERNEKWTTPQCTTSTKNNTLSIRHNHQSQNRTFKVNQTQNEHIYNHESEAHYHIPN